MNETKYEFLAKGIIDFEDVSKLAKKLSERDGTEYSSDDVVTMWMDGDLTLEDFIPLEETAKELADGKIKAPDLDYQNLVKRIATMLKEFSWSTDQERRLRNDLQALSDTESQTFEDDERYQFTPEETEKFT